RDRGPPRQARRRYPRRHAPVRTDPRSAARARLKAARPPTGAGETLAMPALSSPGPQTDALRHGSSGSPDASRAVAPQPRLFDGVICFGGEDWWYHNRGHFDMQIMRELSKRV